MELTFLPEAHTMPCFGSLTTSVNNVPGFGCCLRGIFQLCHPQWALWGRRGTAAARTADPGTFCAIRHHARHLHQGGNPSRAVLLRDWLGIGLHVVPLHHLVLPVQNLCWQHMALLMFLCWIPHKITPPRPQHKLLVLQKICV